MDYYALVDELRMKVSIFTLCGDGNAQITLLMKSAADAIEQLMKRIEQGE